ncbi:hypothetical protein OESDEN_04086 [Oesophagostomum dentatum]|uniref:VWFA domain-containing protein n=1 Tax=Oesophagostomum dentatum TaxID=61180 RepID=A0A0B1TEG1_OESDE|nr:hypothetical protein OESDEN_04086 [Oesophagostomum dentatum]
MVAQENLKEAREAKLRQNVKEVIIIYASDFKEEDEHDVKQLADQIKISGTDIIVVGFDQGGRLKALERMKRIASPGYFFRNTAVDLAGEIQHSLCQTNCFCKRQWRQYSGSTVKFGSCLKIG